MRSGPTPAPLSNADIAPPMGSFGGAVLGSSDFSLATFLNEVSMFVPPSIARNLWGYVNRLTSVGKFDPRQASAEIDRLNSVAMLLKMSVPKRKVTSKFLLDLENFIDFGKKQVYRASVPRNERELLACLDPEEPVYMPSGMKYAWELKNGDMTLAGEVQGMSLFEDEKYELTTWAYGMNIKANGEHPFWLQPRFHKGDKSVPTWVSLKNIYEEVERLQIKYRRHPHHIQLLNAAQFKFDETRVSKPIAKLLGYLCSDGIWYANSSKSGERYDRTPTFTNVTPSLVADFKQLALGLGFEVGEYPSKPHASWQQATNISLREYHMGGSGANRMPRLETLTVSMRDTIKMLNVDKTTFGKIQTLPNDELLEFTNGYFNGDGCLHIRKGGHVTITFHVGLSKRCADELQFMLWRLGINSDVQMRDNSKVKSHYNKMYIVAVLSRPDVDRLVKMLDDRKYPNKFKRAIELLASKPLYHPHDEAASATWVPIRNIKRISRGSVVGWTTSPSHTIIGRLGMLTHNTSVSEVVSAPRGGARRKFLGFI